MVKRSVRSWEVRLQPLQVLVLTGVITGSMAGAFYLGFFSGRHLGLEMALGLTAVNVTRLPVVPPPGEEAVAEEDASEVYAKLNADKSITAPLSPDQKQVDAPELGSIPVTEVAPPDAEGKEIGSPDSLDAVLAEKEEDVQQQIAPSQVDLEKVARAAGGDVSSLVRDEKSGKKGEPTEPLLKIERKSTQALPKGYFAQVAAPRTMDEANGTAEKLRGAGFPVIVEETEVKGERYFRILVGPELRKETADRLVDQLRREPYIQGNPFVRLVK